LQIFTSESAIVVHSLLYYNQAIYCRTFEQWTAIGDSKIRNTEKDVKIYYKVSNDNFEKEQLPSNKSTRVNKFVELISSREAKPKVITD